VQRDAVPLRVSFAFINEIRERCFKCFNCVSNLISLRVALRQMLHLRFAVGERKTTTNVGSDGLCKCSSFMEFDSPEIRLLRNETANDCQYIEVSTAARRRLSCNRLRTAETRQRSAAAHAICRRFAARRAPVAAAASLVGAKHGRPCRRRDEIWWMN
jgi:hypothetical protein